MATLQKQRHAAPAPRWRMPWATAGIGLVMLIGVLLILYPSTASWFSQYNQSRIIENTTVRTDEGPPTRLQQELQRAYEYNGALASGEALLSPESNVPTSEGTTSGDSDYNDLLMATSDGVMGRLRIHSIKVELPIYHGTTDDVLAKGVGHLEGTSLPVGGESQHSVLTAHRGLPSADLFNDLHKMEIGDTFTVEVFGEVLTYQTIDTETILPHETQSLLPQYGEDLITLVTCTPLGINSHRYLVNAERITPTPIVDIQRAGAPPEIPGFPWWSLGLLGAVSLYVGAVIRAGRPKPAGTKARAMGSEPN